MHVKWITIGANNHFKNWRPRHKSHFILSPFSHLYSFHFLIRLFTLSSSHNCLYPHFNNLPHLSTSQTFSNHYYRLEKGITLCVRHLVFWMKDPRIRQGSSFALITSRTIQLFIPQFLSVSTGFFGRQILDNSRVCSHETEIVAQVVIGRNEHPIQFTNLCFRQSEITWQLTSLCNWKVLVWSKFTLENFDLRRCKCCSRPLLTAISITPFG